MQTWACYINICLKSLSNGHGHREEEKKTKAKIMMVFMISVLGAIVGIKLYRKGNSDRKRVENPNFHCIDDPSRTRWSVFSYFDTYAHIPNLLFPKVNTI